MSDIVRLDIIDQLLVDWEFDEESIDLRSQLELSVIGLGHVPLELPSFAYQDTPIKH